MEADAGEALIQIDVKKQKFESKDAQKFKTYLTQEFLKKGYLANTSLNKLFMIINKMT